VLPKIIFAYFHYRYVSLATTYSVGTQGDGNTGPATNYTRSYALGQLNSSGSGLLGTASNIINIVVTIKKHNADF